MNASYVPGDRAVAVGHRAVVMAGREHCTELSALADRTPSPLEVLSALSGGDVARLPDFAAVVADGEDLVVMVRGPYTVRRGAEEWSGRDAATWREHRTPVAGAEVTIEHGEVTADLDLPVATGVVLTARVTWRPDAGTPAESASVVPGPAPVAPDPESTLGETEDDFDSSVGLTVQGQRTQVPPEEAPGDHDGRTVTTEQMQQLRAHRAPDTAEVARRGVEATLAVSGGETVELSRPVIIGRAPRADQTSSESLPQLVVVDDPYVSGTHLEVTVEDGAVVAVDRSTNGTILTRPDGASERLPKDVPTVLEDGCVLGLSEDVTATLAVAGAAG